MRPEAPVINTFSFIISSFEQKVNSTLMIKFSFFAVGLFLISPCFAQTVTVQKQTAKIKGVQAKGFELALEGKKEAAASAWSKFLKDIGKVKTINEYQTVTEPVVGAIVYNTGVLYATLQSTDTKSTVWIGLIDTEWQVNDIEIVNKELEKMVYSFGVKFYRDQIQLQIDEAQKAVEAVERKAQRLQVENKNLNNRLANNEQQKVQLEKALKENELEHLVLQQKILNNKNSQDSVAAATIQIRKALEIQKDRQRKVN